MAGLEFDYNSYIAATFESIVTHHQNDFGVDFDNGFCASVIKYQVNAIFTGSIRSISKEKLEFINNWSFSLGLKSLPSLYEQEIEVRSGLQTYLIPVQSQLIDDLISSKGKELTFFIVFIGVNRGRYTYLITNFQ